MSVSRFPRPAEAAEPDLRDPINYINRKLSWLGFNQRVLDQATGDYHPLLERVKFLAIVASNLDEFFMVRVATLLKKQRAGAEDLKTSEEAPRQSAQGDLLEWYTSRPHTLHGPLGTA